MNQNESDLRKYRFLGCLIYAQFFLFNSFATSARSVKVPSQNTPSLSAITAFSSEHLDSFSLIKKQPFSPFDSLKIAAEKPYYWLHFSLKNKKLEDHTIRLKLFDNWCEEAVVYSKGVENKQWLVQKAGHLTKKEKLDVNPASTLDFPKMPNAVTLVFEASEEKEVYVRYTKLMRPDLQITPEVYSIQETGLLLLKNKRYSLRTAAFMAMLVIIGIFHLFFFVIQRDKAYLYYSIYAILAAFATTIMDDYGFFTYHQFYAKNPLIQPYFFLWIGSLTIISYALFTREYIHTKDRFPRIDKLILLFIYVGFGVSGLHTIHFIFSGKQYINWLPFPIYILFLVATFMVMINRIWKNRTKEDLFFLIGVAILVSLFLPYFIVPLFGIDTKTFFPQNFQISDAMQVGILAELTVFSMGLGYRTKKIQSDNLYFKELDSLKSRFFANISHEFRTPLTLINGPLSSLKTNLNNEEDIRLITLAENNSKRLLKLVNQVLDLSRLEANSITLEPTKADFVPFAKGIFYSFESLASQKKIRLTFSSNPSKIIVDLDYPKIETIIINLVSNALKFTPNGGKVSMIVEESSDILKIQIIDNGRGIHNKHIPHIFNYFYQSGNTSEIYGSGVGLALVKELVNLHDGQIDVFSTLGEGSEFVVNLPNVKDESTSLFQRKPTTPFDEWRTIKNEVNAKNNQTILLVEDHPEVRFFMKSQLSKSYKVIEAKDGEEGIKKALKYMPDIVVSDVMMPERNGYEVTKELKENIISSHIPIILLTAKSSRNEKLEGLKAGADDYLSKPFDLPELEIRIQNLLKSRHELKVRFSKAIQIKPEEVSVNSIDQQFIQKALRIIEANMDNEKLNLEFFSSEMGIGTTQLNLKFRKLIGQSTNQFIKSTRLQRAAELLKKESGTVSEIGYKTGYSSTAYFVSSFKKHFGVSPGNYKNSEEA